jgi:hypothetical protein
MKSPFAIFRKNQKTMTVILTVLAMFAFVVLGVISDSMQNGMSSSALIFIAVLIGAAVFWIAGLKAKKSQEYAITGAILTGAVGLIFATFTSPAPAVQTTFGSLSDGDLRVLVSDRSVANQFISMAHAETVQGRFARPPVFNFGMNTIQQDVALGYLFRHEAEKNGIEVTEESVNNFINGFTQDKLTNDKFKEIRKKLQISETRLYKILAAEMKAGMAFSLLQPRNTFTPEEYWKLYRQNNITEQIELATLPVEEFAKEVPEPSEEELNSFFNQYKTTFQVSPDRPGFLIPPKWVIGYLEINYEKTEEEIAEVTEEDIEVYYKENKEIYRSIDLSEKQSPQSTVPPNGPELPVVPKKEGEDKPLTPTLKEDKKPAEKAKTEKTKTEKPQPVKETKKEPEKKKAEKAKPKTKPEEKPAKKEADKKESPKKKEEKKTSSTGTDANSPVFATAQDTLLVLADDKKPASEKKKEEPKKVAPKKEAPAKEKKKAEEKPKATKEKSEKAPPSPLKKTTEEKKSDKDKPKQDKEEKKTEAPEPKYRPLDNDLKEEIKDEIRKERTAKILAEKSEIALNKMRIMKDKLLDIDFEESFTDEEKELEDKEKKKLLEEKLKPLIEDINSELKKFAEENNMEYVVTKPLSYQELIDEEKNPFGRAATPISQNFGRNRTSLIDVMNSSQVLVPTEGEIPSNNHRIVYWKIRDIASRVPEELSEEGIKEAVIKSYKEFKALDLAKTRAEELQQLVTNSKKSLLEALGEQNISTKEGSPKLSLLESQNFSWTSFPSTPRLNMFEPPPLPRISPITGFDFVDNEIMKTLFEKLKPGETGIVKDAGSTAYYVVQPKNRKPSSEGEMEAVRSNFLTSNMFFRFSPYSSIFRNTSVNGNAAFAKSLREKYNMQILEREEPQR